MKQFYPLRGIITILTGGLVLFGLYLTSFYSYLLFHSLAEIFSIVVACAIFMLAWNTRHFMDENYFLFVGIAYLFVAILDTFHTLAYRGMGVFSGSGANLPTQLWIAGRYLQTISLLLAPLFVNRDLKPYLTLTAYTLVTGLVLLSIFYWQTFPLAYSEAGGLTSFKVVSEYIISAILLLSIVLLFQRRQSFDSNVLRLLILSISFTIAAELAFTLYSDIYGLFNIVGHLLRIVAFYLMYKAFIETGLLKPYNVIFRNLKQSEETLRQYTVELQARNKELDAFAHTVAHDLKSPVTHITSLTSVLMQTDPPLSKEEEQELLSHLQQSGYKISNIVDELLLLAEVRQAEVPVDTINMERIVSEALERLAYMIETRDTEISMPETWPLSLGYGPWIEEVWINYLSNAIKYGGEPPRIELGATPQSDGMVRFWVRDNGDGLSPQEQDSLFVPFTQLDQIRVSGHGLGLSIVRRIIDKLGGQVGVESEGIPGRGSLFFFTLPAADGPATN